MRLKHIKLSGFKSFVDPTKVPFEQQMTAIVGPNGCGKSNIIDAVRWVLGESSAKNLRGDAMTDVIFNGAASRKPVGQASVELVFDNIDNRIQGNLADRSQISVRRLVNREGQNGYYLNGSKCRRRDITDIFLGTGLGPRSYAIIEQGTISRLIESKPQELRVFIEEAAGISKYKERRKETELRIRHTRENLVRLTDLRLELATQIEKLYGQAEAAKRFKTLKAQERQLKAELALMRWQKFDRQHGEYEQTVKKLGVQIADVVGQQKAVEAKLYSLKQQSSDQYQQLSVKQNEKLELTQKIAHAEQNTKHVKNHTIRLEKDNEASQQQLINAQNLLLQEKDKVSRNQEILKTLQPQIDKLARDEHAQLSDLSGLTEEKNLLESQLQHHRKRAKDSIAQQKVLQQKITKTELLLTQAKERLATLDTELSERSDEMNDEFVQIKESANELRMTIAKNNEQQQGLQKEIADIQKQHLTITTDILTVDNRIGSLKEKCRELKAQQSTNDGWLSSVQEYLQTQRIKDFGTVQCSLSIAPGWEKAVQLVLSEYLQALWVEEIPSAEISNSHFLIKQSSQQLRAEPGSLAEKVTGGAQLASVLNNVRIVESNADFSVELSKLQNGQSLITIEGLWLSNEFTRKGELNSGNRYLTLAASLNRTIEGIAADEKLLVNHKLDLSIIEAELIGKQQKFESVNKSILLMKEQLTDVEKLLSIESHKQEQSQRQHKEKLAEREKTLHNYGLLFDELTLLTQQLGQIDNSQIGEGGHSLIDDLHEKSVDINRLIESKNHELSEVKQRRHELVLTLQKEQSVVAQGEVNIVRLQENIKHLIEQQNKTQTVLNDNRVILQRDEKDLTNWLQKISMVETSINEFQALLTQEQGALDKLEAELKIHVGKQKSLEQEKSKIMLDCEGAKLRASSAMEQLAEVGIALADVRKTIPRNAKESQWQAQLIRITKDIANLGTINLAAIEEYESQLVRKNYLDQQDQDLNFAISTLESAIDKIDKESRQKFKATFEIVNKDLKQLFPKVFGGGQAYLALTDDDLLDAGVTIMARPPGKKNSTIHLLSGGEKALTALSLVFAIFRLNPAPFCMLDEVDAPLDDANVERFCNLVREMSNTVQFIYISHNKIAMEMATHLTGVTMFEPGVSRMVAVDIDEAIAMAEVS